MSTSVRLNMSENKTPVPAMVSDRKASTFVSVFVFVRLLGSTAKTLVSDRFLL